MKTKQDITIPDTYLNELTKDELINVYGGGHYIIVINGKCIIVYL